MLAKTLRDDQALAIYQIREAVAKGQKRLVLQAPTGFGKTLLIADIVDRALLKDKRVLITVPAISLVDQTIEVLASQGVRDVGVIQAQHPMTDWSRPVQVASVQTLTNRWKDGKMPRADVVLVDEVHRWFTLFPKWICDIAWQDVPFIGFSATPWTKGLGAIYGRLVVANTIDKLIAQGVLVPFRTFAPDVPDLTGARAQVDTTGVKDFVAADIEEIMRPKKLVANIVDTWLQLAAGRPTVCFCCSRAHADQVAKEFEARGVGAGYLDCDTEPADRAEVRRRMLNGKVQVVCNVEIVGLGVDWPEVSCIIYARPTMSDMRFVQNVGRGLRACQGKTDLLILDHSSTTMRLGMVDEVYALHNALDDGKTKPPAKVGVLLPKPCEACNYLKPPKTATCPACGHVMEKHAEPVAVERGTLREIKPGEDRKAFIRMLPEKPYVYGQLLFWANFKGYKQGWAAVKYQEIFGVYPASTMIYEDKISAPVPELLVWITKDLKRFADRQSYAKRNARKEVVRHRSVGQSALQPGHNEKPPVSEERPAAFVPGTLMTEEDMEEFR